MPPTPSGSLVVIGILAFLVLITIFLGVRIVPQGYKHVVQRLGKYHATLNPGLNFVIPYLDAIAYKVLTKDISLDIPTQEVITRDNAVIMTNAIAFINVIDPQKAVYGIDDFRFAIVNLIQTSLRSIVGEMDLDDALSSRDDHQGQAQGGHLRRRRGLGDRRQDRRDPGHQALADDAAWRWSSRRRPSAPAAPRSPRPRGRRPPRSSTPRGRRRRRSARPRGSSRPRAATPRPRSSWPRPRARRSPG